jgi:hypothetical protein
MHFSTVCFHHTPQLMERPHPTSMPPALALTMGLTLRAQVDLALYVQDRNIGKVHWAMRSLKEAMKCALRLGSLLMSPAVQVLVRRPAQPADLPETNLVCGCRWDEETFGLEYDLDLFNIVAVSCEMHGMCGGCTMAVISNA